MDINWKKNAIFFLLSQTVSIFGSSLVQYAITWHVVLNTGSGIATTIVILFAFIPTFIFSPLAGVLADKYSRKTLIIIADLSIALFTLLLATCFLAGFTHIWLLYIITGIRAIGSSVQTPCVNSMIPDLAPKEHLTRINGINATVQSFTTLLAPMTSGLLISISTIEIIFFIDVITAIIAVCILKFIQLKVPYPKIQEQSSYIKELKEGLVYVRRNRNISKFFIIVSIFTFLCVPLAFLTPLQTTRIFGEDVRFLTIVEIGFGFGLMIGGVLMTILPSIKNKIITFFACTITITLVTFNLGFPYFFIVYTCTMCCFGIAYAIFNTISAVILQENVSPDYIGRVFSFMTMINSSMLPLGIILFGPLSDIISIEIILITTSIIMFVISLFIIFDKKFVAFGTHKILAEHTNKQINTID